MGRQLTLYMRRGCHLCSDMSRSLQLLQREMSFSFHEVDIDRDPGLAQRYGDHVPVLTDGDGELCRYVLDAGRVRSWYEAR